MGLASLNLRSHAIIGLFVEEYLAFLKHSMSSRNSYFSQECPLLSNLERFLQLMDCVAPAINFLLLFFLT